MTTPKKGTKRPGGCRFSPQREQRHKTEILSQRRQHAQAEEANRALRAAEAVKSARLPASCALVVRLYIGCEWMEKRTVAFFCQELRIVNCGQVTNIVRVSNHEAGEDMEPSKKQIKWVETTIPDIRFRPMCASQVAAVRNLACCIGWGDYMRDTMFTCESYDRASDAWRPRPGDYTGTTDIYYIVRQQPSTWTANRRECADFPYTLDTAYD